MNASLQHVLSGCKTALTQGQFKWRHDQVLKKLAEVLERNRQEATTQRAPEAPKKHSLPQARRTGIPHQHKTTLQASNISLGLEDGSASGEAASRGVVVSIDKDSSTNKTDSTNGTVQYRGYIGNSTSCLLKDLGLRGTKQNKQRAGRRDSPS